MRTILKLTNTDENKTHYTYEGRTKALRANIKERAAYNLKTGQRRSSNGSQRRSYTELHFLEMLKHNQTFMIILSDQLYSINDYKKS